MIESYASSCNPSFWVEGWELSSALTSSLISCASTQQQKITSWHTHSPGTGQVCYSMNVTSTVRDDCCFPPELALDREYIYPGAENHIMAYAQHWDWPSMLLHECNFYSERWLLFSSRTCSWSPGCRLTSLKSELAEESWWRSWSSATSRRFGELSIILTGDTILLTPTKLLSSLSFWVGDHVRSVRPPALKWFKNAACQSVAGARWRGECWLV